MIILVQSFWINFCSWVFACWNWRNFRRLMSIVFICWTVVNLLWLCCNNDLLCINMFPSIFRACLTREILISKSWSYFFMCTSLLSFFWWILELKSLKFFGKRSWCIIQSLNNRIGRYVWFLLFLTLWKSSRKLLLFIGIFLRDNRLHLWWCDRVLGFFWNTSDLIVWLFRFDFNNLLGFNYNLGLF